MQGRSGLDRFKKAQTLEPFSVSKTYASHQPIPENPHVPPPPSHVTQIGGGQSTWQPPDWAIEPRPGLFYLQVVKDGEVLDQINLDRRRHIFGRQLQTCDFVLDHQSVSRQHAAVVPHKNGSVFVIDLGSAHGTFVANERVSKDSPVELEAGQSLRFAASTRTYILRKNDAALFPAPIKPTDINILPPPDPSDEDAILAYNTCLNRYGLSKPNELTSSDTGSSLRERDDRQPGERSAKRMRRIKVAFRDQVGGELVEVVGISDGADVETEPGPLGVKEGSLVGKYESLVQTTVIPKGKEQLSSSKGIGVSQTGVTQKLQQVLNKVKAPTTGGGIYDDLYGESFSGKDGSSWAYPSFKSEVKEAPPSGYTEGKVDVASNSTSTVGNQNVDDDDDDDDLFG